MISAKIISDSISEAGKRITSFELVFPKFLVGELNTHRALSRNSASSRAIPVEKMIEHILESPATPVWWGKNQSGMQAKEELDDTNSIRPYTSVTCFGKELLYPKGPTYRQRAKEIWLEARNSAIAHAKELAALGCHKQIVNRIIEPWMETKVIATATDWDNFFYLRNDDAAQPEIHELARLMVEEYRISEPFLTKGDEWHVPYIDRVRDNDGVISYSSGGRPLSANESVQVSASLCAQVSYRKADDSIEKAIKIYERLISAKPPHASPMEHQAFPVADKAFRSGNFNGWVQNRQLIKDNCCLDYFSAGSS